MILNSPYITGSITVTGNANVQGTLTVTGQIIAQTINVQQVTSSIVFSSGSNVFGNQLANRQTFTGSVNITGSLALAGNDMTITSTVIGPMFILNNPAAAWYSQIQFKGDTKDAYIFKGNSTYASYGGANALNFYTDPLGGGFSFSPRGTENAVFIDPAGNLGIGVGLSLIHI